jgi:ribonuclease HI
MPRKKVIIYTDGACLGNPGPGGYGVVLLYGKKRKEISGGFRRTTNNRMELFAAITGLKALKEPCNVTLYTDSRYLVDAMSLGWAKQWKQRGWKKSTKEPARNADLWEQLLDLTSYHHVTFEWVPGHSGVIENERCDELSVNSAKEPHLPLDQGYEIE